MSGEYQVIEEVDSALGFDDEYGTGWYIRETWRQNSVIDRQFGPAVTIRHPGTLKPIREEFFHAGKRHRYGGPAVIEYHHPTGKAVMIQFFQHGKEIIPDQPCGINGP